MIHYWFSQHPCSHGMLDNSKGSQNMTLLVACGSSQKPLQKGAVFVVVVFSLFSQPRVSGF